MWLQCLISMFDGKPGQDFPRSAAWLEPWSVGSLTGLSFQESRHLITFPETAKAIFSFWQNLNNRAIRSIRAPNQEVF